MLPNNLTAIISDFTDVEVEKEPTFFGRNGTNLASVL